MSESGLNPEWAAPRPDQRIPPMKPPGQEVGQGWNQSASAPQQSEHQWGQPTAHQWGQQQPQWGQPPATAYHPGANHRQQPRGITAEERLGGVVKGLLMIAIGIAVTVVTYNLNFSVYFVAWGPVIFGLVTVFKSLIAR